MASSEVTGELATGEAAPGEVAPGEVALGAVATDRTEVLIVGAGPTGLALACDLRRRGIDARIVEQRDEPSTTSRAFALHARGLEILEDLGAGAIVERTTPVTGVTTYVGGRPLTRVRLGGLARHGHPGVYLVSQADVEAQLRERLGELGTKVEFGARVTELQPLPDHVRATIRAPDGTAERTIDAAWVVGCDGAHSTTRQAVGILFEGSTFEETFLLADLELSWPFDEREIANFLHPRGVTGLFPLPAADRWRLVAQADTEAELPDDEPAVVAIAQDLLDERTGRDDVQVRGATWWSRFRIHRRLAASYRAGRVLLAGDAAHVHSPFGGQGMNVGLGDASNLGWKLATLVEGRGSATLLDSYEQERRPVAEQVVDLTSAATRIAIGRHAPTRFVRDRILPALADARADRPTAAIAPPRAVLERFAQLRIRYRHGVLATPQPGIVNRAQRALAEPVAGDRAPDAPIVVHAWGKHHGQRAPRDREPARREDQRTQPEGRASQRRDRPTATTLRRLASADWLLLHIGPPAPTQQDVARAVAHYLGDDVPTVRVLPSAATVEPTRWQGSVDVEVVVEDHRGVLHRAYRPRDSGSVLLRPDGHVGWRSGPSSPPIERWLQGFAAAAGEQ